MKRLRILMAALCVAALMCAVTVTAYAGAPDYEETGGYEPPAETVTETPAPEPVAEEEHFELLPGQGFSEDGNLATRDLLYDKYANKQFITVETAGGNLFYIIIDYDKPMDEAGERYETYFLSLVDEADLLALAQSAGVELPHCICKEKCMPGTVNIDCPVCSKNMSECTGAEPAPAAVILEYNVEGTGLTHTVTRDGSLNLVATEQTVSVTEGDRTVEYTVFDAVRQTGDEDSTAAGKYDVVIGGTAGTYDVYVTTLDTNFDYTMNTTAFSVTGRREVTVQ